MPVFGNILAGASGQGGGYTIDQSIRFNKDDDAKLTRTFGTATNRKIYTLSVWEKNGNSAGSLIEYNATGGVTWANITFGQNGRIDFFDYSGGSARIDLRTSAIFRDPSSWYHVVVAVDTTQATSTDRIKMYVNGVQITSFGTATYPSQNFDGFLNSAVSHLIGDGTNGPFDGYLAEYHFIDGQALDPTSFGETDATTGQWVPIAYTGSYGTNGFYITGENSASLGTDYSGNGNNFTSSGLTSADQMLDTPTDNFCTLSPIDGHGSKLTLSDGNLRAVPSAGAYCNNHGTFYVGSGKWVYEVKHTTVFGEAVGWSPLGEQISGSSHRGWFMFADGRAYINTTNQGTLGASLSSGDYRYIFYDADNQAMWFAHCDVSSGTPTTLVYENGATKSEIETGDTTNAVFTSISAVDLAPGIWMDTSGVIETNFGQSSFYTTSTLPTGFNSLSTANLSDPTIADPTAYFDTLIYSGDGTASRSITGLNFDPNFVWLKRRDSAEQHLLFDSVRGDTLKISSNSTSTEFNASADFEGFTTGGFIVNAPANVYNTNDSGSTQVAWNWKANGSGSSNTDGSITSTVSANTTAGFSIASFTNTGVNFSIGHGLSQRPDFLITKARNGTFNWEIWHKDLSDPSYRMVFTTSAQLSAYWADPTDLTNIAAGEYPVTSTLYAYQGGSLGGTYNHVAYFFHEVEGFSKFTSIEGTGNADGTFCYLGFRPALVMLKSIDSTSDWHVYDNQRAGFNVANYRLEANSTDAETTTAEIDLLSNGFKLRIATDPNVAETYIVAAWAESPFKTANAR